jgi:hypothetical protein
VPYFSTVLLVLYGKQWWAVRQGSSLFLDEECHAFVLFGWQTKRGGVLSPAAAISEGLLKRIVMVVARTFTSQRVLVVVGVADLFYKWDQVDVFVAVVED